MSETATIEALVARLFASKPAPTVAQLYENGTVEAGLPANHAAAPHHKSQNCARVFSSAA